MALAVAASLGGLGAPGWREIAAALGCVPLAKLSLLALNRRAKKRSQPTIPKLGISV